MKIAEMEAHHDEYTTLESRIIKMLGKREFPAVFPVCEASFAHIVPAIRYRKKRGMKPETPRLSAFSVICKYGPPLFEHAILESLLDFVRSTRLLAKHENGYLQSIERALEREEVARILWNHLEHQPGFLQRHIRKELGISQESAVAILAIWEELGVIARKQQKNSYALYFRSRLDAAAEGICQTCGVRGKGRKELFFRPVSCKNCGTEDYYHIINTDQHQ